MKNIAGLRRLWRRPQHPQRWLSRGASPPDCDADIAILALLPLDDAAPYAAIRAAYTAHLLADTFTTTWMMPWDDSAFVMPWICRSLADRDIQAALEHGAVREVRAVTPPVSIA